MRRRTSMPSAPMPSSLVTNIRISQTVSTYATLTSPRWGEVAQNRAPGTMRAGEGARPAVPFRPLTRKLIAFASGLSPAGRG
jgi:hypothetical protein